MTNDTQKMLTELEKQIAQIKQRLDAEQRREPTKERAYAAILRTLKQIAEPLTVERLCAETKMTKGTVWRRIEELTKERKVRQERLYGEHGRPVIVIHHADNIAS